MTFYRFLGLMLCGWSALLGAEVERAPLEAYDLRCDGAVNPLGIDSAPPRLSWKLRSDQRAQRQVAWQVLVASSAEKLARNEGDLWDSARRETDAQLHLPYGGGPLLSSQEVFWKVRVFDPRGIVSPWSEPAKWTMGVLPQEAARQSASGPVGWRARWITARERQADHGSLLLRREFTVKSGLRRALVHVTGVGAYEFAINGERVGNELLAPGWTDYAKTCFYATHDVTALVQPGQNAAGIFLGNAMYSVPKADGRYSKFTTPYRPPFAIAQLRFEYADGRVEFVGTDDTWRTHVGPITFSHVFGGEDHDARLVSKGWMRPGFDESRWLPAAVAEGPGGVLRGSSEAAPPITAHEILRPVAIRPLRAGVEVYDLGQNAALIPRLRVRGAVGTKVKIVPSELLNADGTLDRVSVGVGNAWWSYTLAGGEETEEWQPKFFYHGCRYLQVERTAPEGVELPTIESLAGVVVHSSASVAGDFACSSELFNRIRQLVRWAQRSNTMSVITDCPHRERLGWLEQYHLNGPALRYEHDLARLFAKTFGDMADAQTEEGLVPDIAPEFTVFSGGFRDSPEWGSAFILAAWQQYLWTGDDTALKRHFDGMTRYVAYLGEKSKDHIVSHGLGDWYDIGPKPPGRSQLTPVALTATAFYFEDVKTLAEIARVIGRMEDARRFETLSNEIRAAFNREFFAADRGSYATGSQTANAIPLVMGLVEPAERERVFGTLVRDVRERSNAVTAGDVGYRYLLRALADGGRSDVVFDLNHQSEKPGYGFQLARGATSLTEAWDARRTSSQNHFMLGQITEWFYCDLAGLSPDSSAPGFKNVIIRPQPVSGVDWARASFESPRGKILSAWKREHGGLILEVEIPPGATATVHVPVGHGAAVVREGTASVDQAPGVRRVGATGSAFVFAVQSGQYRFSVRAGVQ